MTVKPFWTKTQNHNYHFQSPINNSQLNLIKACSLPYIVHNVTSRWLYCVCLLVRICGIIFHHIVNFSNRPGRGVVIPFLASWHVGGVGRCVSRLAFTVEIFVFSFVVCGQNLYPLFPTFPLYVFSVSLFIVLANAFRPVRSGIVLVTLIHTYVRTRRIRKKNLLTYVYYVSAISVCFAVYL